MTPPQPVPCAAAGVGAPISVRVVRPWHGLLSLLLPLVLPCCSRRLERSALHGLVLTRWAVKRNFSSGISDPVSSIASSLSVLFSLLVIVDVSDCLLCLFSNVRVQPVTDRTPDVTPGTSQGFVEGGGAFVTSGQAGETGVW